MLIEREDSLILPSSIFPQSVYGTSESNSSTIHEIMVYLVGDNTPTKVEIVDDGGSTITIETDGKNLDIDASYFVMIKKSANLRIEFYNGDEKEATVALPIAFLLGAYEYLHDNNYVYVVVNGGPTKTNMSVDEMGQLIGEALAEMATSKNIVILPSATTTISFPIYEATSQIAGTIPSTEIDIDVNVEVSQNGEMQYVSGYDIGNKITMVRATVAGVALVALAVLMSTVVDL